MHLGLRQLVLAGSELLASYGIEPPAPHPRLHSPTAHTVGVPLGMHKEVSSVNGDHLLWALLHATLILPQHHLVGAGRPAEEWGVRAWSQPCSSPVVPAAQDTGRDGGWGRDEHRRWNSRDAVACSHHPVRGNEGAATGVVEAPILLILK